MGFGFILVKPLSQAIPVSGICTIFMITEKSGNYKGFFNYYRFYLLIANKRAAPSWVPPVCFKNLAEFRQLSGERSKIRFPPRHVRGRKHFINHWGL